MNRSRSDASAEEELCHVGLPYALLEAAPPVFGAWAALPDKPAAPERRRWLARTIETEIIPRLMLVHRTAQAVQADLPATPVRPTAAQVDEMAHLVLDRDSQASLAFVQSLRAAGVALELIYLELLAPSARLLGAWWDADLCSFADVTLGLWRLQQVMHAIGAGLRSSPDAARPARRAILVPVPGSQHTMGLFIVSEFFRRAGWEVWGDAAVSAHDIVAAARREWFDLLGVSLGSETHVDALASVILDVRKASRNRALVVIIGGPIVASIPGLLARVGADATAEDAPQAVSQAESLLAERSAGA